MITASRTGHLIMVMAFCALVLAGCGGAKDYDSTASSTPTATVQCTDCHGTAVPAAMMTPASDPMAARIKSDITDTHYDDMHFGACTTATPCTAATAATDCAALDSSMRTCLSNGFCGNAHACTTDADCEIAGVTCLADTFFKDHSTPLEGYILDPAIPGSVPVWGVEGRGYVSKTNPNACAASCHTWHEGSSTIRNQWAGSGHAKTNAVAFTEPGSAACTRCHSGIGLADYLKKVCSVTQTTYCIIDGDCPSGESCVDRVRSVCQKTRDKVCTTTADCPVDPAKTSAPFTETCSADTYPKWSTPAADTYPNHITCNACHDAKAYPTSDNKRLRRTGNVTLISGSTSVSIPYYGTCSVTTTTRCGTASQCPSGETCTSPSRYSSEIVEATLDVANAAVCLTCHQMRESGQTVFRDTRKAGVTTVANIRTIRPGGVANPEYILKEITFVNTHYLGGGATLYGQKGFEFLDTYAGTGTATVPVKYTPGNAFHQSMHCTGCHMDAANDQTLGGHTFHVVDPATGKENIDLCKKCHGPGVTSFETLGGLYDFDGDGKFSTIKTEIEGLKTKIKTELAKAGRGNRGLGIFYDESSNPYFFSDPTCRTTSPTASATDCRNTVWKVGELEAAFNLQFVSKDPGAYVHNYRYAVQLLRDAYENLSGTALGGARPGTGNDRPGATYVYP